MQEEGKDKKTFKPGDRADVGANVKHEAWIGPEVPQVRWGSDFRAVPTLSANSEHDRDQLRGCKRYNGVSRRKSVSW